MPSINLLPEDFTIESYKKRERVIIYILAVFFLLISFSAAAGAEINRRNTQKDLNLLNDQISSTDKKIQTEIGNSKLFTSEYNKDDIEKLLEEHYYYSKALEFLKDNISADIYLSEMSVTQNATGDFVLDLKAIAKSYDAAAQQIVFLKNSYWVKDVNIKSVSSDKTQDIEMAGNISFRKELFTFNSQYWNAGFEVLGKYLNRYIQITDYSATLENVNAGSGANANTQAASDTSTANGSAGSGQQQVHVRFKGVAYSKTELDNFEANLKADTLNIDKVKPIQESFSETIPGIVSFSGEIYLKY